jgi:cytochrome c5
LSKVNTVRKNRRLICYPAKAASEHFLVAHPKVLIMKATKQSELRISDIAGKIVRMLVLGALPTLALTAAPHGAHGQEGGRSGKEVVEAVCSRCHATGEEGAPRIGDRQAWAKRASLGLTSLTKHALEGIRKMPPHGGSPGLSDLEIQRAITYMVNQSGGNWIEPLAEKEMTKERTGEQVVRAQCARCHEAGVGGAPRIGDRSAWTPRMEKGLDVLVRSAIRGHGGMPPRGGQADLTDSELRSAVLYMFNPAGPVSGAAAGVTPAPSRAIGGEKTIGGLRIFVGFTPAEAIKAYPSGSTERTMHGGVPEGPGYYHLNVSLFDRMSNEPVRDAKVEVRIEQAGLGGQTKTLELMSLGPASYGGYVHAAPQSSYEVTLRIRTADSPNPVEWRFEHTF